MTICATCGHVINHVAKGVLIADEHCNERGNIIGFINWRCVHKGTCNPHTGPWHDLDVFHGRRGERRFQNMCKTGAFEGLSSEEIERIRQMVVQS